jgi:hypothetical protein
MKSTVTLARTLLLGATLALTGCATSPPQDVRTTAPTNILDGTGRIVFYRPSSLFGYGMRPDILLDGKKVGRSVSGSQFSVDTPTGVHHVTVPNSMYSGERGLAVTVRNKETAYVRTSLGGSAFGGRTNVELIDASQATTEAKGLDPLGD